MEQEVKVCDEVERLNEFTYLVHMVSAVGGCEAAVTVRTRHVWDKPRECREVLHGRRLPPKQKWAVHMSYIRTAILHGSEALCLKKLYRNFTKDRNIHGESNVWSAAQRQKKIYAYDVHAGFEGNNRSVGNGKQCSLVWSCVEERGWSRLKMLRLKVKGRREGQRGCGKSRLRKKV